MRRRYPDLGFPLYRKIIDQLSPGTNIGLHGLGEPTLHPNLVDMVQYSKTKGMYVYFNTNLSTNCLKLLSRIVRSGLDELRVSLSASSVHAYYAYTGRDCYNRVVNNLSHLISLRQGEARPLLRIVFVLSKNNMNQLLPLIDLCDQIGIEQLSVQLMQNWGNSDCRDYRQEYDTRKLAYIRQAIDNLDNKIQITLPPLFDEASHRHPLHPGQCQWPVNALWITAAGMVTPCCNLHEPAIHCLGDVSKQSLLDIWHGSRLSKFRLRYHADEVSACRTCPMHHGAFKKYQYLHGE